MGAGALLGRAGQAGAFAWTRASVPGAVGVACCLGFAAASTPPFGCGRARAQATSVSQFEVLDVAWVEDAGGDWLEAALLQQLAAEAGTALSADVAGNPRAMAKLRKQVCACVRVLV